MDHLKDVAIIGAGLGGCALALALAQHNVPVTIYESRSRTAEAFRSGVILTPNGLWVLDRLGVFERIKDRCYKPTHRVFKNDRDETVRKTLTADESVYGYCNHRLWRKILLDEMKAMLDEGSIAIHYGSKFNGVVSDTGSGGGVEFLIGEVKHYASIVIGSDGIFSSVRNHIEPGVVPEYTGLVGILCHIKTASVHWPYENYERNCTIQGKPGAIFYIPEDPSAETIMIGVQVQHPEQSREDVEKLQGDADRLVSFFQSGYDEWGPTVRSIIDAVTVNKKGCYAWPFIRIPRLQRWHSQTGRVIIVGDSAHGLPPSSGQGVNQALEDVYSLTRLLTSVGSVSARSDGAASSSDDVLLKALEFWQQLRQVKIDAILDWTLNSNNANRLPAAERERLIAEGRFRNGQGDDMRWLYQPNLEHDITAWLDDRSS